ncbi:MAG: polyprenol monophosphomannose synthase [Armatimonadota bacterium]|nr:polyprenol monophosphomannose synthase [Armatimonadota bacterium]
MNGIVIIPTYNEAANLEPLVHRILSQPVTLDVLIVDDNSPDGTGDIADRLARDWAATRGRVHVLHRPGKEGLGRAYLAGFAWALARDYQLLIEMDADFSHDPIFLQSMVEASDEADVVLGSRYLNGISVVNWPLSRILLSWGANQYVRLVTGLKPNDCTSGYRVYRREALEAMDIAGVLSSGYSFQVEMTFRAALAGCRISEVPIIFTERREGSSKMSRGVIWESVRVPLKLRFRERALRTHLHTVAAHSAEAVPTPLKKAA